MTSASISPETMLPELIRAHPQTRSVFDSYGLSGCGGAHGPVESIRFFARAHGVEERKLLAELELAVSDPHAVPPAAAAADPTADTIYRRFFTAGILTILTAGATWGAWLLWRIGVAGNFTAISIHEVNAHGHAQIAGWVGLFIMGFAYQSFPRIWHTQLAAPRLAVAVFVGMCVSVVLRSAGMLFAGSGAFAVPLATAGGILEIAAVTAFAAQILCTFRKSTARLEPYLGFILAALGWFVLQSAASVWHTWNTMTAVSREELLWYVATYQAPLRDLQIHGLALCMILGVSLRMLPGLFDLPSVRPVRAWTALALITFAVIGESVLFVVYRLTQTHLYAALLVVPWIMLLAGAAAIVLPWKLWRAFPESDRSAKFIRAAYLWLFISLIMLLLLPVYQLLVKIPFSHAYYGAVRHAITVGFISLMIMGFAAKVIPTLNGIDTRSLSPLWGPFIMVNVGCLLRVGLQTLTDWYPPIFALVGISGTLEVAGLAWWGAALIAIMLRGKAATLAGDCAGEDTVAIRPSRIAPTHHVADVVKWYPQTLAVFERHGFKEIRNPMLRRTVARHVTLQRASALHGVELTEFLADLNRVIGRA